MGFFDKHGRYLLMALTVLHMAGGVLIIGLGVWILFAVYVVAGVISILIGLAWFSVNFLGFRGALTENRHKLRMFGWISLVLVILAIIGTIFTLINGSRREISYRGSNAMTIVSLAIEVLCIVLAFGLASAIEKKSALPPMYSSVEQAL